MMKAAVLNTPNGLFSIENIEIDHPKGREVLVEVKASYFAIRTYILQRITTAFRCQPY